MYDIRFIYNIFSKLRYYQVICKNAVYIKMIVLLEGH